jgi:hypothetical protein
MYGQPLQVFTKFPTWWSVVERAVEMVTTTVVVAVVAEEWSSLDQKRFCLLQITVFISGMAAQVAQMLEPIMKE